MRRPAQVVFHIALLGFILTIAANLLNRRDIASLVFGISCICLLTGTIITLSIKFYNINSINAGKMRGARKIANILIYFSLSGLLISLMLSILHIRPAGRQLMIFSSCSLLCGLIIALFTPSRAAKTIMNPDVYSFNVMSKNVIYTGAICFITGMLFRILHYSGGQFLLLIGLVLYLIYFILRLYHVSVGKKYPILNLKTMDFTPSELDQYLGIYYNSQMNMDITITKNDAGTSLVAQATNQNAFPLSGIEKNIFNYDRAGIVIEFKPDNNEFILIQYGGYFPFIKK